MPEEPTYIILDAETGRIRTNIRQHPDMIERPPERRGYLVKDEVLCDDARRNPAYEDVVKMDGRTVLVDKPTGELMEHLMALNFIKD